MRALALATIPCQPAPDLALLPSPLALAEPSLQLSLPGLSLDLVLPARCQVHHNTRAVQRLDHPT